MKGKRREFKQCFIASHIHGIIFFSFQTFNPRSLYYQSIPNWTFEFQIKLSNINRNSASISKENTHNLSAVYTAPAKLQKKSNKHETASMHALPCQSPIFPPSHCASNNSSKGNKNANENKPISKHVRAHMFAAINLKIVFWGIKNAQIKSIEKQRQSVRFV